MSSKAPWLDAYKLMATYPQLTHLMSCLSWVREGGFAFVINAGVRGLGLPLNNGGYFKESSCTL